MNFCHIILTVKNLDVSIKFYRDIVGLPLKIRQPAGPNAELAFLGNGDTLLELLCAKPSFYDEDKEAGNGVALGFVVESLENKLNLLREGGYETDGVITSPAPNMQFLFAKDPDGYNIQFVVRK